MRFVKTLLAALALSAMGCDPDPFNTDNCEPVTEDWERPDNICQGRFSIDVDQWSRAELEEILDAVATWNVLQGSSYFSLVQGTERHCHIYPKRQEEKVLATYWNESGNIQVDSPWKTRTPLKVTIMHELGHSLGMAHGPRGLMCSTVKTIFTQEDWDQCQSLGYCNGVFRPEERGAEFL